MIKINQKELFYLQSKGFKFPDMLHKDYSGHGTYYATEDRNLIKELNKYRKANTISTYTGKNE